MGQLYNLASGRICRSLAAVVVTIAALLVMGSPPAKAAKSVPLANMAGQWTGNGWASRTVGASKEKVRCRLKAKYNAKTRKLSLSGKCAASSGTYTLLGHIAEYAGSKKLTGRWVNPKGIGSMNIAGNRSGNRLTFRFNNKDKKSKRKVAYKTVWDLRSGGFSLNTGLASGAHNALGQIDFQR
ncbi:MAG: hypothetical protein ABJN65_14120 [Parasphingorhabdus sp.]